MSTNITPLHYTLFFDPNFDDFTFTVETRLCCTVDSPATTIHLHSLELEYLEQPTIHTESTSFNCAYTTNDKSELVTLSLPEEIEPQEITIHLKCKAILNDNMQGFYRSSYMYNDEKHWIASTQFEAVDARRAFPALMILLKKAKFSVGCSAPKGFTALSNQPILEVQHKEDKDIYYFDELQLTPTYLVAIAIGEFEYIETKLRDDRPVRCYCRLGQKNKLDFALDVAKRSLEWFEDYFGIKYQGKKMDLLAIPSFNYGAMENTGLETYRETCLFCDPISPSIQSQQRVAMVICHEHSHQWFGNYASLSSFKYLYVNEAFAEYLGFLCAANLFPEWNYTDTMAAETILPAMKLDALSSSHPIEVELNHPREIDEIFDHITYLKGCSLVRMIAAYMGEDGFRKSLSNFLSTYAFSNANSEQLWSCFSTDDNNLVDLMKTWVTQKGFPHVRVSKLTSRVCLRQEAFKGKEKTLWPIPLKLVIRNKEGAQLFEKAIILDDDLALIDFPDLESDHVLIVNPDKSSFAGLNMLLNFDQI
ncbi:hypothetical protein GEMRC1_002535 [Eukaryota sp. GEM-RC1]